MFVVCSLLLLVALGYGLLVRATLQLESERRYVMAAAPVGGSLG
jgi:hypothetical protein